MLAIGLNVYIQTDRAPLDFAGVIIKIIADCLCVYGLLYFIPRIKILMHDPSYMLSIPHIRTIKVQP